MTTHLVKLGDREIKCSHSQKSEATKQVQVVIFDELFRQNPDFLSLSNWKYTNERGKIRQKKPTVSPERWRQLECGRWLSVYGREGASYALGLIKVACVRAGVSYGEGEYIHVIWDH